VVVQSVSEQRAADQQLHLKVARLDALALEQEVIGVASAYRLVAPSITESLMQDPWNPAWARRVTTPVPVVHALQGDSLALAVDVPP
jgi:hypothetical protein